MLRNLLRRPSHATVVAYLGLFVALGGTAYAVNTVRSSDIVDGEVRSVDIRNDDIQSGDVKDNSINTFDVHSFLGADVADGSLTADDIGIPQVTGSGWGIQIGVVNANSCTYRSLNGLDGYSDHLDHIFIQPHFSNSSFSLIYTAEPGARFPYLKICNPTTSAVDDGFTSFNTLAVSY